MAYFTVGSLISCGTNIAIWQVTQINPDGTLEAVFVSGRREPALRQAHPRGLPGAGDETEQTKTISRPEKYRLVKNG